jgi:hypothetical protein
MLHTTIAQHTDIHCKYTAILSAGVLTVSGVNNIDFEVLGAAVFTLTISVTDGRATDTQVLEVTIQNRNEAPIFGKNMYTIAIDEGVVCIFVI